MGWRIIFARHVKTRSRYTAGSSKKPQAEDGAPWRSSLVSRSTSTPPTQVTTPHSPLDPNHTIRTHLHPHHATCAHHRPPHASDTACYTTCKPLVLPCSRQQSLRVSREFLKNMAKNYSANAQAAHPWTRSTMECSGRQQPCCSRKTADEHVWEGRMQRCHMMPPCLPTVRLCDRRWVVSKPSAYGTRQFLGGFQALSLGHTAGAKIRNVGGCVSYLICGWLPSLWQRGGRLTTEPERVLAVDLDTTDSSVL